MSTEILRLLSIVFVVAIGLSSAVHAADDAGKRVSVSPTKSSVSLEPSPRNDAAFEADLMDSVPTINDADRLMFQLDETRASLFQATVLYRRIAREKLPGHKRAIAILAHLKVYKGVDFFCSQMQFLATTETFSEHFQQEECVRARAQFYTGLICLRSACSELQKSEENIAAANVNVVRARKWFALAKETLSIAQMAYDFTYERYCAVEKAAVAGVAGLNNITVYIQFLRTSPEALASED